MRQLKAWSMGFLLRLRRHREVKTKAGKSFLLGKRFPEVDRPLRERVDLCGSGGARCRWSAIWPRGSGRPGIWPSGVLWTGHLVATVGVCGLRRGLGT